jgi:DNA (cytosine-5)-methyltransferase 1
MGLKLGIEKIPILSFFSGGGFLDLGFESNGFDIIWSNEINPDFIYLRNYAYNKWLHSIGANKESFITSSESIENLTSYTIQRQAWHKKPSIFGIVGGPPCQDFSRSGTNYGFNGGRGKLTKILFQIIEQLKPSFFVVENVQNLYRKHKSGLYQVLKPLSEYYYIDLKVLNSIDFGVPQDRNRLFIVGFNKLLFNGYIPKPVDFWFNWPQNEFYQNAINKYDWPKTNPFQSIVDKPNNVPIELTVSSCLVPSDSNIANANEFFKSYSHKFWTTEEGDTKNRSFKRLHRFRYSPTACYGNNEVHLHPYEIRRISVREALRIQSVPDSYELPKYLGRNLGLSSKFKMIGNAVPAVLAGAVAQSVYSFILNVVLLKNGYLDKEKEKCGNVKNLIKRYETGEISSITST